MLKICTTCFFGTMLCLACMRNSMATPTDNQVPMVSATISPNTATKGNPIELGDVQWLRDLDAGRARAQAEGKPLLILFQEVPGCSNCTRYGSVTLSHPLIVEAIETFFVPVCIYNNEKGKDAEALKRFGEPSWNNPVVRIVDADYTDLVPRMADFRSQAQIVQGIVLALKQTKQAVPEWLRITQQALAALDAGVQTATFSMHCFWVGEGAYGLQPGVLATKAGWQDGKEVVQVQYDPTLTNEQILAKASGTETYQNCKKNEGFKLDREPKYYLSQTDWRFIPMTDAQATHANALAGQGKEVATVLSPRQVALAEKMHKSRDKVKGLKTQVEAPDFTKAWKEVCAKFS